MFSIKLKMFNSEEITLRLFFQSIKKTSWRANNLQSHKRRLSEAVRQVQDYIQCFKMMDLDKRGVIYPKILQNYLIKHKYYLNPTAIARFYSKYAHEKPYLGYQDILESLLPHQDYILVTSTVSNISHLTNVPIKFTHSCTRERVQIIDHLIAFILQLEIKYLTEDYSQMSTVTCNSQRIGSILWRLLDRNHNNLLDHLKLQSTAQELGVKIDQTEWKTFLYWHFHSYKQTINRSDFMRLLDIQQERKRATSACKIESFKTERELYKRAEEDRLQNIRIQQAIKEKLVLMSHLTKADYRAIVQQEHFPYQRLNQKKELKGKVGYRRPNNLVKYIVEREQ